MGFVYEEAIDPQIVEVDGVVLPALGKLFQLLFVLLNLVLDLTRGPLLSSRLRTIGFSAFTQQVFHLLHLSVDSLRFPLRRDGEHVELGMRNDDGVPFISGDTAEKALPAEWGIEISFRHGQNIGGRIGFFELFAPLLNHVVRDNIEVLARDPDSSRFHSGNNHGERFPGTDEVVEKGTAFDHDAPGSPHLIPVESWHAQIGDPTIADSILDRLVHNAYRIEMDGESMRGNKNDAAPKSSGGRS